MTRVLERADQLVLDYVSRVADAAHGVLRTDQRLDFVRRLRTRVEEERGGSEDARFVTKVIARFGPPEVLVEREAHRLADASPASGASRALVAGDSGRVVRPVAAYPRDRPALPHRVGSRRTRHTPLFRLRSVVMATTNPMATDGRDGRTILLNNPRETFGGLLLIVAALLVPFRLPVVAIFPVPLLIWVLAALIVLASGGWIVRDRVIGLAAPLLTYVLGGGLLGWTRSSGTGIDAFMRSFHGVSGVMFILGTAGGVCFLAYRLLNPPLTPRPPGLTRSGR